MEQFSHIMRSPHLRQTMKLEKPRRLSSSMVCSRCARRLAISFIRVREKVAWRLVSRNSTRMSTISTSRHRPLGDAFRQTQHFVLALIGVVARFDGGRGRAENGYGVGVARTD